MTPHYPNDNSGARQDDNRENKHTNHNNPFICQSLSADMIDPKEIRPLIAIADEFGANWSLPAGVMANGKSATAPPSIIQP